MNFSGRKFGVLGEISCEVEGGRRVEENIVL